jgi:TetR/AcrR family transcriptional repressor of nem operon
VANHTLMMERFFHGRVVAGQRAGEIPNDQAADDIAKLLLAVAMGLRVLVRVRPDPELLAGLVRPAMAMLNLPWPLGKESVRKVTKRSASANRRK